MRTLVLTTEAFGGHGGIAKFSRDLLTALCAYSGCTAVVAVPRRISNPMEPVPATLTYEAGGVGGKIRYLATVLNVVRRHPGFDLIVCGHINLLPIGYLLRWYIGSPIILLIYGIDAWKPTGSRLTNRLARKVDALVSVSEVTRQRFLHWAKVDASRTFLLPNAIDLHRYGPGPKNAALLNRYGLAGQTVLMTMGRLVPAERFKGFDEVLELLPTLAQEMGDLAYLIVGDGPDRMRLEEKARRLGVQRRCAFTGFVSEDEKAEHYRLADAFVMPSQGEGFGIVLLEAMACGIPVVASRADGTREAVQNGTLGVLVDPTDPNDIKRGIAEALTRPRGIVPDGLDFFSYANFERRCHHILDQVVPGGQRRSAD